MAIAIDTLAYARRLREAGFSELQAEGQAEALAAAMTDTLATKQDLSELDTRMNAGFAASRHDRNEIEVRINARFTQVDARLGYLEKHLDTRLNEVEKRMDARFAEVSARFGEQGAQFRAGLADLERRMTMRLGAVIVAAVGVVSAVARLT